MTSDLINAKKELIQFLAKNSELIPFQIRLESAMDIADPSDPLGRIKALNFYISDNIQQLLEEFQLLAIDVEKLKNILK